MSDINREKLFDYMDEKILDLHPFPKESSNYVEKCVLQDLKRSINSGKFDSIKVENASLITTIESQNDKIAFLEGSLHFHRTRDTATEITKKDALIESQKEEIEKWKSSSERWEKQALISNSEVKSLKAITELAVKENERLKAIQQTLIFNEDFRDLTPMKKHALAIEMMADSFWEDDSEIERLQNEQT